MAQPHNHRSLERRVARLEGPRTVADFDPDGWFARQCIRRGTTLAEEIERHGGPNGYMAAIKRAIEQSDRSRISPCEPNKGLNELQ